MCVAVLPFRLTTLVMTASILITGVYDDAFQLKHLCYAVLHIDYLL